MKNLIVILLFAAMAISCKSDKNLSIQDFKTGTFETFLDGSDDTSTAVRNDSIQVDTYELKRYTYKIEWKSNFEYILTNLYPRDKLDSTQFFVKITGIKGSSYTFKGNYEGSNFKQTGTVTKILE